MMTWGFPCTDISVAGKQKGFIDEDGEKTRSGMYYEGIRILRKKKPALSIIENVKNLTGKRFKNEFEMVLRDLDDAGYNSYYQVLNAKNYGIPQNRERVFIISIRKDLDNGKFKFPKPFDNGLRLKDLLEDEVDEKFYISEEKTKRFITNLNGKNSLLYDPCQVKREGKSREYSDYAPTLTSRDYKDPRLVNENVVRQVGNISDCNGSWNNPQVGRVYDASGCSPTLNTCGGGGHEPKVIQVGKLNSSQDGIVIDENGIAPTHTAGHGNTPKVLKFGNINPSGNGMNGCVYSENGLSPTLTTNKGEGNKVAIKQATKQGYIECEVGGVADLSYPNSKTRRGRVQDNGNTSPTITTTETGICRIESSIRIRKLTPRETFRLMGFSDENFDAAKEVGISNSQLYKQAGNSIVVDVLYYIYVELYKAIPYLFDDLKLSSFFSGIGAFEAGLDRLYQDINSGNFQNPQTE